MTIKAQSDSKRALIHYNQYAQDPKSLPQQWVYGTNDIIPALRAPFQFYEKILIELIRTKNNDEQNRLSFLDYGCGMGIHSILPATLGCNVTGIDISPNSIKESKILARKNNVESNTTFDVGDCERLPYNNGSFDIVFSSGTLCCLDHNKCFAELARVLKPGGRVILVDTLGHNPLLNWLRRIKVMLGLKPKWLTKQIIKINDLSKAKAHFKGCEINYFDLLTLWSAPLRYCFEKRMAPFIKLAQKLDRTILNNGSLLKYCAYKFVCVLSKPIKSTNSIQRTGTNRTIAK